MHPHHGQVNWYRHALCAWLVIALAGSGRQRSLVSGRWGHEPASSNHGVLGGMGSSLFGLGPLSLGLGTLLLGGGGGWGLGAEAKPINVTVGPLDPSVELLPMGAWTLERLVDGDEDTQYAVARSEPRARALFDFDAIARTSLYYTTPLFPSDTSVTLSLDTSSSELNVTRPPGITQTTRTILIAQDLREGRHSVTVSAAVIDGQPAGSTTFGFFTYTTDDELPLPASPSSSSFESLTRPTGVPLNDTTTPNVNAASSANSSDNKKLVIPLAVIGALLGILVIGVFLLWIFKFPHYCCGPARKVIYKHVHAHKPQRDEKGMIDLTDGEPEKRASSTTEEGYGSGKALPPTPFDKPAAPVPAARQPQRKVRIKVPEIPGLAAFSTKVKNVRLGNPLSATRGGPHQKGRSNKDQQAEDPIDRHFELMTTGSPLVPQNFVAGLGGGAGYPTANNDSGGSFDPRTLVAAHTAPATNSNSDLSYVTAPNPPPPSTYPPQQTSPLSPLRHQGGAGSSDRAVAGGSGSGGKATVTQSYGGNPYLLNSNPKSPNSTSHARQASSSTGMRADGRAGSNAGSTSPTVTVRQLALDLPYLQYLDALTVPASRISQMLAKSPSSSGSSQRGGVHQRNGGGGSSRLATVPDGDEGGMLRNVAPLSNKHLAALNVEVQKEKEREESVRKRGTEESSTTRPSRDGTEKAREEPAVREAVIKEKESKGKGVTGGSKFSFGAALGRGKTKGQEKSSSSPKTTTTTTVEPTQSSSSAQPSPASPPSTGKGDGSGLGVGADADEGPIGTGLTSVSLGTSLTGMTIAATGAPTTGPGARSSSATTVVGGLGGDASPHPKKTSFWGAWSSGGGGGGQNTIPLPPTPASADFGTNGGRQTPSFGDGMVVTQPRSRTTSASGTGAGAGAPPSSMWKMAVPQRRRRDSSVEREKREKFGPRDGPRGAAQKERDGTGVATPPPGHIQQKESMSSSGHGEPTKIRPLPSVAPLQLTPKPMRELPKPVLPASPPPPAQSPPSREQEEQPRAREPPPSPPPPQQPMGARERSRPTRVPVPQQQARSSAELQQQLNDVLSNSSPSPPPAPPAQSLRTLAQRVQTQPTLTRMDSVSSDGHTSGSRRPLPLPPPADAPAAVPAPQSSPPAFGTPQHQPQSAPQQSQPQPYSHVPAPPPLTRQESERRANPPPPRPPPRPSLPPSAVSAPVLSTIQSKRAPVPTAEPPVAAAAPFQPLPTVIQGSGDLSSDWSDMTFGMGRPKASTSSSQPKPFGSSVSRPQPSIPKPAPAPSQTIIYQPSAPTAYSASTYDDEDGEDSIYADYEGTWTPAPPPSMASVPPTPLPPRTAADGNASYPDFPKPVQVSKLAAGSKAKTRVKPKGPSGSKGHGGSGGGSGSFGQKKDVYDPVWRPDAV